QTYHRDAESDLAGIIHWARTHGKRVTVRLVKGAYWDYETVQAAQNGWSCPVWLDKADSDACFERCTALMLQNHDAIRSAIGSHNVRSIAYEIAQAEKHGVPNDGFEIQCLYGMAEPIKAACAERGLRVRVYTPVGELIPGMAYLVRRLLENTSNESWLKQGFADGASQEELLESPQPKKRDGQITPMPNPKSEADDPGPFINEPLRDFTHAETRETFRETLEHLSANLGGTYGPIIDGENIVTDEVIARLDPADESTVVGHIHFARTSDAERAIAGAHVAFKTWRNTPVQARVQCVLNLAAAMRAQRDHLSALMVREVGKPWREADADTAEAIDFCEYYAREMLRLSVPQPMQTIPGEVNLLSYAPRGVCAVIAPWNFPLAILAGMTTAAAVAGNTVVMKPAEQSSVIAAHFMTLIQASGFPSGVIQFVPGRGETVGEYLVNHPGIANITFTGSREVGLHIWARAGQTIPGQRQLKRVVCEMGGKNAIIVDSDADIDEAVLGVIHSAFAFSGQKCSACSRVIVLEENYDIFVERLVEAARSLDVRPPAQPEAALGPVIDRAAQQRLLSVIADAESRGRVALLKQTDIPSVGTFVGPTIFGDVPEDDPLAQDEFFGPIIAIIKAVDFEDAIRIANGTAYALTGGIFSRSPSRIDRARDAMHVGNLYINRSITGAIVGRQPFGGSLMSGGGTKAGGPDYLLNFLDGRTSTENTLRRGFTPESV
ncbi:MAG: L-glutamate gamma-semialdehyde dehydrogenase, partial [Myxococcota bacterium]|nr:L-glutamate gamma-semialdehyde dehydrogenase [Myxococcota bacterium]